MRDEVLRTRASDHTELAYRVVGDEGPWVVLVQGLSLSGRFWFEIPAKVAALGARVIVPDNRGTGRSGRIRRPFTMSTLADDLQAIVDHAGCDTATVVGISMGGMIAQNFVLLHPSRVDGLVLLATTPGLPHGSLPSPFALADLARMPFAKGREAGEIAARLLLSRERRGDYEALFSKWPEAFAADPQDPRTFFLQLGAIALHSVGAKLREVRVPTAVIAGREDRLVPFRNSEEIASRIDGAVLRLIDGVGHSLPSEVPTVVEQALQQVWAAQKA
ncbi:MAG: alpha/beta hydrolase [Deltaproteobacteria bacterium]|nr:alpha/beta hydrolase [Deltaproteobacteria bacterium]